MLRCRGGMSAAAHDPQNLMCQILSLGKRPFAKCRSGEREYRKADIGIFHYIGGLVLLLDYRYVLIVFREVRLAAHPDPGRTITTELRNAGRRGGSETSRPDFFLAFAYRRRRIWRRLWQISPHGRVRSCTRQVACGKVGDRIWRVTRDHKEKGRRDKRAATRRV